MRAARRRGCASEAQDKVSPRGKAPGRFWPPYAGGHSYAWEVYATDLTGFSNVSHFAGQNGTLIRRPRWRARACEMGGAGGARPRTLFAWFEAGCLVRRYWGLRPLAPPIMLLSAVRAKRSIPRSAVSKAIRRRDDHLRYAERHKRQPPPTTRTKAFFFGAPLPFLWARPKKWGGTGPLAGAFRQRGAQRLCIQTQPGLRNWRGEGAVLGGGGRFSGAYTRWR